MDRQDFQDQIDMIAKAGIISANDAYQKLKKTPEWDTLIEEFFFTKEVSRVVLLKASPHITDTDRLDRQITMYGEFKQFLMALEANANRDESNLIAATTALAQTK